MAKSITFISALGVVFGAMAWPAGALAAGPDGTAEPASLHEAAGTGLRLNGFGTLGVAHARAPEGWGLRRAFNQPSNTGGTRLDVDSRLGLQANYAFTPEFELVGQVLLKRLVTSNAQLEWAFAAWRPRPDLTLRLGRTSTDIFLASEYRSVGFAYPSVRPNVDTYGPLPLYAIDGVDLTWHKDVDGARWRVRAFAGQGSTDVPGVVAASLTFQARDALGITLSHEVGPLSWRATAARFKGRIKPSATSRAVQSTLQALAALPVPAAAEAVEMSAQIDDTVRWQQMTYLALGLAYDDGVWLASAEWVRAVSDANYLHGHFGYLSLGRRFGDVTLHATAGRGSNASLTRPPSRWAEQLAPLIGPQAALQAQWLATQGYTEINSAMLRQRSLSLGIRWDVHPRAALKLQFDRFVVERNGSMLWAHGVGEGARPRVVSLALDFVF
ncbi:hypothetical protein V4F39_15880 [Aquincola sp. MAHUQ-54]|uniref:Porin n=1 Tax=Aquincola agrisoli TaxID=3119538 RepID=A0AAW9Q802_9BURK